MHCLPHTDYPGNKIQNKINKIIHLKCLHKITQLHHITNSGNQHINQILNVFSHLFICPITEFVISELVEQQLNYSDGQ